MTPITTITDLQQFRHWIVFTLVPQPGGKKPKKVPYTPGTNREARVNDPSTWRTYAEASADAQRTGRHPGVAITPAMNLTLVDIDGDDNHSVLAELDSYTERSINGGWHGLAGGRPPEGFTTPAGVEVYPRDGNRFVLLTGDIVDGRDHIVDRTDVLARLFPPRPIPAPPPSTPLALDDDTIIAKCRAAKNGAKFDRLFAGDITAYGDDDSRADQALFSLVTFFSQDIEQVVRIVERSALWRPKLERRDYQLSTFNLAMQRAAFYTPPPATTDHSPPMPSRVSDPPPAAPDSTDLAQQLAAALATIAERDATIAHLHTALDQCCGDRATMRTTIAEQATTIANLIHTALNPHLTHNDKVATIAATTTIAAKTARGDVTPAGNVVLEADDLSNDHRPKAPKGGHISPVNPLDGSIPRMPRSSARAALDAAIERGVLPAEKVEATRTRRNGSTYPDWDYVVASGTSPTDILRAAAHYHPDQPKARKVREPRRCPHCGELLVLHRIDACAACGGLIGAPRCINPNAAPPAPSAQTDMGEKTSPIAPVVEDVLTGRKNFSHSSARALGRKNFSHVPPPPREPDWLADAPDPWDAPPDDAADDSPQPALFRVPDVPRPFPSHHFSAD